MDPLHRQAAVKAVADFEKTLKDDEAKDYAAAKKARQAMRRKVTLAKNSVDQELIGDGDPSKLKNYLTQI